MYSTASAKACFLHLRSLQEKAKIMIKWIHYPRWKALLFWQASFKLSPLQSLCWGPLSSYFFAQRRVYWYNGFLTASFQHPFTPILLLRSKSRNHLFLKRSNWKKVLRVIPIQNHLPQLFPFLSLPTLQWSVWSHSSGTPCKGELHPSPPYMVTSHTHLQTPQRQPGNSLLPWPTIYGQTPTLTRWKEDYFPPSTHTFLLTSLKV